MKHENEEVRESAQYTKAKAKGGRVPRLRFPEFRDSGNWPYCPGNEMFESISNKEHNSDLPILAISQEHGAVPRDEIDYNVVVTDKSIESYKVVEVGDFIISLRSFQGGIEYSRYKGICSPAYIILRKKSASIENQFFRYYYKCEKYIEELNRNIEGIRDGKMVSYSQFSQIFLPFPSPEEQRKIAACLSSLDELIAAHGHKLAGLMDYKKGLMQQLFPAEGESVPRMRFSEFIATGEWTECCLENVVYRISSGTSQQNNIGGFPLYGSTGIIGNCENPEYDGSFILVARVGANAGSTMQVIGKFGATDNTLVVRAKESVNITYLVEHLVLLDLANLKFGSGQPLITGSQLKALKISLPPVLHEQCKIASTLSSLDDLIAAEKRKLEGLEEHKRGLLQGLFPAPEENE